MNKEKKVSRVLHVEVKSKNQEKPIEGIASELFTIPKTGDYLIFGLPSKEAHVDLFKAEKILKSFPSKVVGEFKGRVFESEKIYLQMGAEYYFKDPYNFDQDTEIVLSYHGKHTEPQLIKK